MKKKGFTLLELLAVMVVLAILVLIATPLVLNIIESSKKNAAKQSANGYMEAVNNLAMTYMVRGDNSIENGIFTVEELNEKEITVGGAKPSSGWVRTEDGDVNAYSLTINGYVITWSRGNKTIVRKDEGLPSMKDMCPGCVFAHNQSVAYHIGDTISSSDYTTNYKDLDYSFFLGFKLDKNNKIEKIYTCGDTAKGAFCFEGSSDGSTFANNKYVFDAVVAKLSSAPTYEEFISTIETLKVSESSNMISKLLRTVVTYPKKVSEEGVFYYACVDKNKYSTEEAFHTYWTSLRQNILKDAYDEYVDKSKYPTYQVFNEEYEDLGYSISGSSFYSAFVDKTKYSSFSSFSSSADEFEETAYNNMYQQIYNEAIDTEKYPTYVNPEDVFDVISNIEMLHYVYDVGVNKTMYQTFDDFMQAAYEIYLDGITVEGAENHSKDGYFIYRNLEVRGKCIEPGRTTCTTTDGISVDIDGSSMVSSCIIEIDYIDEEPILVASCHGMDNRN